MALYLIAFNDEWVPDLTLEELRDRGTSGRALIEEMTAAGVFVFSDGGLDASTAVCSVDPRSGSPVFTDGPFAETKEHLGGFTVVDVPGDAEARYWAGRIAVAVGWPQEVHRFPHRALSADTQPGALSSLRCSEAFGLRALSMPYPGSVCICVQGLSTGAAIVIVRTAPTRAVERPLVLMRYLG